MVAVTACPTGIAHTYMAEESLHKTAQKMGVAIKVETNGSEGIKHQLAANCDIFSQRYNKSPMVRSELKYIVSTSRKWINPLIFVQILC